MIQLTSPRDFYNKIIRFDYLLVDVRPVQEYMTAHMVSAQNIPPQDQEQQVEECLKASVETCVEIKDMVFIYDNKEGPLKHINKVTTFFQSQKQIKTICILQGGISEFVKKYPFLVLPHEEEFKQEVPCYPAQVDDNLYLGSEICASSKVVLKHLNIKAILNATRECPNVFEHNSEEQILYFRLEVVDNDSQDMLSNFGKCIDFIETASKQPYNVLVHCALGRSRSACIVIAYLMHKYGWSFEKAIDNVRQARYVQPNPGFVRQLQLFELQLKQSR